MKPGETKDLGTFTPPAIGRAGPITITTADRGVPAEWRKSLSLFFTLPDTGGTGLAQAEDASLTTYVPSVPGATFRVNAWRFAPELKDPSGDLLVQRESTARTAELPLSTSAVSLSLERGPDMIRPVPQGTLPRSSGGLAWQPVDGGVTYVILADRTRSTTTRVYMVDSELALARLERLGVAVQDGPHSMNLFTGRGVSLDDLVEPDPAKAKRFWDSDSTTRFELRFTITP